MNTHTTSWFLILSVWFAGAPFADADDEAARDLPQPLRALTDGSVNTQGTAVVKMWQAPMPQAGVESAGFPQYPGLVHHQLYAATFETGAYNHHANLGFHAGRFYAMWSNNFLGEDASGQRVLYTSSDDGENWKPAEEIFPSPDEVRGPGEVGHYLYAGGFVSIGDRLFAAASLRQMQGWENADRTSLQPTHDAEHIFQHSQFLGRIMREVHPDGSLGDIFQFVGDPLPPDTLNFAVMDGVQVVGPELLAQLREVYAGREPKGARSIQPRDDARMSEPDAYQLADGSWICLLRDDKFSHRMYVSVSKDGANWSAAWPTNIPDSPSLTDTCRLDDGTILLVGNQMAPIFDNPNPKHFGRDPLTLAVSRDGLHFTEVYALRSGQHEYVVERTKVHGRGGGAQYPNLLVHDGSLYVLYSMGKEAIWLTRAPLAGLE